MSSIKGQIAVCVGIHCQENNSIKLKEALANKLYEKGLQNDYLFFPIGCFGLCQQGPAVLILSKVTGKTVYCNVKLSDVDRIVEEHLINNHIQEDLLAHQTR